MPRIDDLPADRRAVLQLLLKQGKSYDDLASLLRIEPDTVAERARDALDRLGVGGAGIVDLDMAEQDEIADYLLGQQSASERASTRDLLETSAPGRAWARVVSGELRPLAGDGLPEIPSERAEVDEAFGALEARKAARQRQAKSSRLGGVLLLTAVGVAVAFLIVFVISGNDDEGGDTPTTAAQTTGTTSGSGQQVLGQVNLNPVEGSGEKGIGAVTLVAQGDQTAMVFQGQEIPANGRGDVYALWVITSENAARLGFTPRVGKKGRLRFSGQIPDGIDLSQFEAMVLTRETTENPKTPGKVIIAGSLPRPK